MAAFVELAAEATAEELAPLIAEDITSVVPFGKEALGGVAEVSELESLEAASEVSRTQKLIESSIKPLSGILGATAVASATLGNRKRKIIPDYYSKKKKNMVQNVKVTHVVKQPRKTVYGASRRYKTGKRIRRSRKGNTNAVKSFRTSTRSAAIAGSYRSKGKIQVVSRTMVPRAQGLQTADLKTSLTNDVFNNGSGFGNFGYNFKLSDFTNYTDFTAMYRFYKILWVKLYFYPEQNTYVAANSGTNDSYGQLDYTDAAQKRTGRSPCIACAPDQTSSDGFGSFDIAMSHDKSRFHMFNDSKELMVYLVPTISDKVGVASASTSEAKPMWISTDHPDELHYGLRCFAEGFSNNVYIKVIMTMKVAFKDLKH